MMIQGKVWGYTCPLFFRNNVEVHFIKIKKGGYCSLHAHKTKFNQFIVFDGKLEVIVNKDYGNGFLEDKTILERNQSCIVPPGENHRFVALEETTALELYWVELNQNDIIRQDQGGIYETKTDLCNAQQTGRDRQAIFVDERKRNDLTLSSAASYYDEPLYGKKYFGNE